MGRKKKEIKLKETVRIREKKLSDGNISLYLDMYYKGIRKKEGLKLYILPETSTMIKMQNANTRKLAEQIKAQATTMEIVDEMKEFVRRLWQEHLKRRRASLPVSAGEAAAARERIELTVGIKRVAAARWPDLKVIIKGLKEAFNDQTK